MGNKHKGMDQIKQGMLVYVKDNKIDLALRKLKRRVAQEGVIKELRARTYYESPSEKRARERAQARSRWKKKLKTLLSD